MNESVYIICSALISVSLILGLYRIGDGIHRLVDALRNHSVTVIHEDSKK